jgi:hypothetical protein
MATGSGAFPSFAVGGRGGAEGTICATTRGTGALTGAGGGGVETGSLTATGGEALGGGASWPCGQRTTSVARNAPTINAGIQYRFHLDMLEQAAAAKW